MLSDYLQKLKAKCGYSWAEIEERSGIPEATAKKVIKGETEAPRIDTVIALVYALGGMREGEICALTSDDINGNFITVNKSIACDSDGKWQIKTPKTFSSNRQVEMPEFVINEIKHIGGKITRYNPHSLSMAFNKLLKNNDMPHFRFHDLRHYYVSSLHAMNIPDKYIMAQGGWATNYTMQNVYNHTMATKQSEFATQIANHFEKLQ